MRCARRASRLRCSQKIRSEYSHAHTSCDHSAGTVTPPYTISTPIATVPSIDSLAGFTATNPYNIQIKTQSLLHGLMPRLMQYNLDLQYQLDRSLLLEVSYSGAKGDHFASGNIDENQIPFSTALAGNGTVTQAEKPFPNMGSNVLTLDLHWRHRTTTR